jgi:transcriptional regulator
MYRPDEFRVEDVARMHELMRARPFASLISNGSTGLYASHLPTVLKDEGSHGVIECHLARANPHWKDVANGNEALMIFQGPEGYITPNWYPSKAEHGKVVPTWNYAIVHAYGHAEMMENAGMWESLPRSKNKPRRDLGRFRTHLNLTSMPCCVAS